MLSLQDGEDTTLTNDSAKNRSNTVDLSDQSLLVDISDALSERDKVKFTVHTKTTLSSFAKHEFSVVRQHEEFVWLHDTFEESENMPDSQFHQHHHVLTLMHHEKSFIN